ncbi:unnamed protein product, partial [Ectocarpus fasciculatus]
QVSGLQLSTPVETVPVVVTYSAVCGGIFFHAPAVVGGSSAPYEPASSSSPPLPRVPHGDPPDGTTGASRGTPESERIFDADGQQQQQQQQSLGAARGRKGQAAAQSGEAAQLDEGEDGRVVTVRLDDAFPGKVKASPVSLRSTAAWEGRVEGMESSGPLIKATLARRDVPGVLVGGGGEGTGAGVPGGIAAQPAVVEVGRVEYDAARDCAEANAWTCLARTVEEASHRRRNSRGGNGGGGDSATLPYQNHQDRPGGEKLELTLIRLVEALHDDSRVVYQGRSQSAPQQQQQQQNQQNQQQENGSPSAAGGKPGDGLATYRCREGHVITVEMEDPSLLGSELEGCGEPRFVAGAGKALAVANWRSIGGGRGGPGPTSVNDRSTAAAKELWGLLPSIAASGLNRFREEVSVSTTLGPAARPLEVLVSLTVPRLVVGVAAPGGAAPRPLAVEAAAAKRRESEGCGGGAAAAAYGSSGCPYDQKRGSRRGYGGDGVPVLRFPVTQVGEERDVFMEVANPADVPVMVQLSAGKTDSLVWQEPGTGDGQSPLAVVIAVGVDVSGFAHQQGGIRDKVGGEISAFHIHVGAFPALVLPPGGAAAIGPLRFTPMRTGTFSAHVYLRNNLTHLEPVRLEGEAGVGLFSVRPWEGGGARPGRAIVVSAASTVPPELEGGSTGTSRFGGGGNAGTTLEQQQQEEEGGGEEAHDKEGKEEAEEKEQREHHPPPPALEVERFPVNFRSWAKSPPTTAPVVRRWVLSNEGTMPRGGQGGEMQRPGGGAGGGGGGWGGGRRGAGGRDPSGSGGWFGRRWRALLGGGGGGGGNNAERDVTSSVWGLWGAVSAAPATTATAAGGIASSVLCADGGFRVLGEACQDRWRPKTLLPGQEMEVAVDYSAAHCEPVGRTLDFLSSAGTASIRMEASASGGPSAVAACKSARRAAAAVAAGGVAGGGKGKASGGGDASSEGGGGGGGDARWSRAWLLVKTVVFAGALYTGGCAMLGVGPEVSQLLGWARRARARAAGCYAALAEGCGRIAVFVEQRKGNGGRGSGGGGGGGYPHYRGPPGGGGGYGGGNRGQQHHQWVSSPSHHGNWSPGRGGGRGPPPHGRMSSPNSSPRFSSSSPGSPHLPALSSPAAASVASMGGAVAALEINNNRAGRQQHQQYRSRPSGGGDRYVGRRGGGEFRTGGHAPAGDGGTRTAASAIRTTTFAPGATAGQGSAAAAPSSRFGPRPAGPSRQNSIPPSSGGNSTRSAGAGWLGVEAGGVEPFQRPLWAPSESSNQQQQQQQQQQQRSPALGPTAATPLACGSGGIGASPTLTGLHASPPLAPIGSNRHRRQLSDGSGSSSLSRAVDAAGGSSRRSPPGLPPPPAQQRQQQQPMGSLLGALGAAASAAPSGRDPDLDNLETFATASAVAAGVLDMTAGEGGGGGPTVPLERCNERTHPAASLDAGTAAEDDARNGRSFSVPSMYFGQQQGPSPPAAAAANGPQYGQQQGLVFGAAGTGGDGGGGVFDGGIIGGQQGRFSFHHGGRGGLAPARTVGGAGPAAAAVAAASGGSRLGFYMSAGGGGGGGGSTDDVFGFMNDGDQK